MTKDATLIVICVVIILIGAVFGFGAYFGFTYKKSLYEKSLLEKYTTIGSVKQLQGIRNSIEENNNMIKDLANRTLFEEYKPECEVKFIKREISCEEKVTRYFYGFDTKTGFHCYAHTWQRTCENEMTETVK